MKKATCEWRGGLFEEKKAPEACVPHVAGVQGRENDTVEGDPLPNSDAKISLPAEELSLARISL